MAGPIKEMLRRWRLAYYLSRHGGVFRYHGLPITVPDDVKFALKKQLMRGQYEEPERGLISRHLDPRLPVVELGGSLGIVSAYVGSLLMPEPSYTIVEANPRILDTCRANAASTRPDAPLSVIHAAIAYDTDSVTFTTSDNTQGNHIAAPGTPGTMTVPAMTLSSVVAGHVGDSDYTLIMDIEGAEMAVMAKDGDAFARCALAVIEVHPRVFAARGESLDQFMALAKKAGMRLIDRDGDSLAFARA